MKIAFDARGVNLYRGTGIGTYTDNLLQGLLSIDKVNEYFLYWSGNNYGNFKQANTNIKLASKKHHKFFQEHYFPAHIKNNNIDIYHISQNGIGLSNNISCLKVVTIHDLIPYIMPETVGKGYLCKFLKDMPSIIDMANAIITVSKCSKDDILRFFNVDPAKIFVTPLAASNIYKPMNRTYCKKYICEKYGIASDFILYVGGFSKRKNVSCLIKAFLKLKASFSTDIKLLLCGAKRDEFAAIEELSKASNFSSDIVFTDYISIEDMPLLYNACSIFVYPSLYEGFGLPPLEAMKCGIPVIASNIPAIREVTQDSAILFNPSDINALTENIYSLLNNENKYNALSALALKNASKFSWGFTAKETLKIYTKVVTNLNM